MGGFFTGRDSDVEELDSNPSTPIQTDVVDATDGGLFDDGDSVTSPKTVPATGDIATTEVGADSSSDGGFFGGQTIPGTLTAQVGPRGEAGPQGPMGETGLMGGIGLTGGIGLQGKTGSTGAQGIQGVQGEQGIQGNPGPVVEVTGGTSQYQAFRTINGSTLQWDDEVTDVAARISEGWTIISGLTTDTFDVSNNKLRRLT